jgi:hypothetical protein
MMMSIKSTEVLARYPLGPSLGVPLEVCYNSKNSDANEAHSGGPRYFTFSDSEFVNSRITSEFIFNPCSEFFVL